MLYKQRNLSTEIYKYTVLFKIVCNYNYNVIKFVKHNKFKKKYKYIISKAVNIKHLSR